MKSTEQFRVDTPENISVIQHGRVWEIYDNRLKKILATSEHELYALTIAGVMEKFLNDERVGMTDIETRIGRMAPSPDDIELGIAIMIATNAHTGQYRRGGDPYIMHPIRVMGKVSTRLEKIVAILHDVLEDCPETKVIDLVNDGISDDAVTALDVLNKKNYPDYETYIKAIVKFGQPAVNVKLADLEDNMDHAEFRSVRLNKTKYQKAYNTLERSLHT